MRSSSRCRYAWPTTGPGRTPRISSLPQYYKLPGRDHWGKVQSVLLAGGGVQGGRVVGSSDKIGGFPRSDPQPPENLAATGLITTDRPYAGWLYSSLTLQRRGTISPRWLALENFRLDLGVTGRESLAQEAQEFTHDVKPRGWA